MTVWMIIAIYIFIGYLVSVLYQHRDLELSNEAESLAYRYFSNDTASACFHLDEAAKCAGWCFWRRKKPFAALPRVINEIVGIVIWPIDLILGEVGYKREIRYLEDLKRRGNA